MFPCLFVADGIRARLQDENDRVRGVSSSVFVLDV